MQVGVRARPILDSGHDIAFRTRRSLRRRSGQLASSDAICPVSEILQRNAAQLTQRNAHHVPAGLPRLDTPGPRIERRVELSEARLQRAGREIAELVATDAAHVLYPHEV